jgi:hypothetical protein
MLVIIFISVAYNMMCMVLHKPLSPQLPTMLLLFMSIWWDNVSELRPLASLLFIPQMIYEYGEPRWNYVDRGKPKNLECHFVHHRFNMNWPGRELRPSQWEASCYTNCLRHSRALLPRSRWVGSVNWWLQTSIIGIGWWTVTCWET